MAIQYQVQAQVVDLRSDTPRTTDRFYVDSNVWFWTAYSNIQFAPNPPGPRAVVYPKFLQQALNRRAELYWCGLSLAELAHQIEKTEFDIYCQAAPPPTPASPKEYRHNLPAERQRVVQEIQAAWQAIQSMGKPLPAAAVIDETRTINALQQLAQMPLDGYDLFALQALQASGLSQVISDDGDFCLVPGLVLFTANRNVVAAAQAQGKLVKR